jgi:hypothetical protein
MKTFALSAGSLAVALAMSVAVPAAAAEAVGSPDLRSIAERAHPGESFTQYGYRRGYGGGYGRGYGGYGRGYRRGGIGPGGAVALGLGGLAAGALIGGAIANSPAHAAPLYSGAPVGNVYGYDPNWVSYCAASTAPSTPRAAPTWLATASGTPASSSGRPGWPSAMVASARGQGGVILTDGVGRPSRDAA